MFRHVLLGLGGLLLAACATPPAPVDDHQSQQRWQSRIEQLMPLQDWQMRGRVAVFIDNEVYNLGLRWSRDGEISRLSFEASLGQGLIQLDKNGDGVELETSEGEYFRGSDAQQLIQEVTGLVIPVQGLESWIKGIPYPLARFEHEIDEFGRANHIVQDGWFINYLDYEAVDLPGFGKTDLPRRLYMKRDKLALKIVLDQWQSEAADIDHGLFPDFPAR